MSLTWNPIARQFVKQSGESIPRSEVRGWVRDLRGSLQSNLERLSSEYANGVINQAQWAIDFQAELKASRVAIRGLVSGGHGQVTSQEWAQLGGLNRKEFSFFQQFERDVANGELSDLQIADRARLYAGGIERLYEDLIRQRDIAAGATMAVNVLGDSKESCEECPALTASGPMPVDDMPEVGARACGPGCNCEVVYITPDEMADYQDAA